jgi:hypothetical protein
VWYRIPAAGTTRTGERTATNQGRGMATEIEEIVDILRKARQEA